MSTRYSLMGNLRRVSVGLILCSTLPAYGANVGACRQPTPSSCAADGICRPHRETWGTYRTQWRPWPGDSIVQSKAAGPEVPSEAGSLEGFQPPSPKDEDLRGPAKIKESQGSDDSDDAPSELDAPAGGEPIPTLPGFDAQGQLLRAPSERLAISLQLPIAQNVAMAQNMTLLPVVEEEVPVVEETDAVLHRTPPQSQEFLGADPFVEISDQPLPERGIESILAPGGHDPPPVLPSGLRLMLAPSASDALSAAAPATKPRPQLRAKSPLRQATWNQPSEIGLINPAAALVAPQDAGALQQAIYYEATDQSDAPQTR